MIANLGIAVMCVRQIWRNLGNNTQWSHGCHFSLLRDQTFCASTKSKKSIVASPLMFVSFRMHQSLWMLRIHSARFNTWQRLKIAQCLQKVQSCHREYLNFRFVSQAKFKVEFAFAPINNIRQVNWSFESTTMDTRQNPRLRKPANETWMWEKLQCIYHILKSFVNH